MIIKFKQKDKWFSLNNTLPGAKDYLEIIVRKLNDNRFGSYIFKQSKVRYYLKAKEKIVVEIIVIKDEQQKPCIQLCFRNGMDSIRVYDISDFINVLNKWYEEFIKNPFPKNSTEYIRKGIYSINDVLDKVIFDIPNKCKESEVEFDGDLIYMNSHRYQTFKRNGIKCVCCGLEGKYFAKERDINCLKFHFNLYGLNDNGEEVMLTKDHIIPKSKSGVNHISNYQTMCCKCNKIKGNNIG